MNPCVTTWDTLLGPIQRRAGGKLKVVSSAEWVEVLRGVDVGEARRVPAIKILGFFEWLVGMVSEEEVGFETGREVRDSWRMRRLRAVQGKWMEVWLDQWGF